MTITNALAFGESGFLDQLSSLSDRELDQLGLGVITFDAKEVVRRHNLFESKAAGLSPSRVIGLSKQTRVKPDKAR